MQSNSFETRQRLTSLPRESLESHQLSRLNALVQHARENNAFYREQLSDLTPLQSLRDLRQLPITNKNDLISRSHAGFAANLSFPVDRYVRFHRTSGTHGEPLVVLDTEEDWRWWIDTWQYVLDAANVVPTDRAAMAFSFGPFIGFWSANDAIADRGAMVIPCGGMDTVSRIHLIETCQATVVLCTPTYALRMASVARENSIDLHKNQVSRIIVAGEPGGSLASVRDRIQSAWNAKVVDHSGASEVGPWGFSDSEQRGLHVIESEFLPEFISVETGNEAKEGELSELYLTPLGRFGSPLIRYRTGDLVRPVWDHGLPARFVLLDGGVLGRADDMMIIRGVNIFPSSIEQILREFEEVEEFRMIAFKSNEMDQLEIEVEDRLNDSERIANELRIRLGLTIKVTRVKLGSLPRFEAKGRRFVDKR